MIRHERNMMPSAKSPTMSRGWREFLRLIRLSIASTAAIAPSPRIHSAATSGTTASRREGEELVWPRLSVTVAVTVSWLMPRPTT